MSVYSVRTRKPLQALLRLVKSDNLDLCNSCSFTAASPRGSTVRPVSISLTEDGASPTKPPISASVMPVPRRSEIRDDQVDIGSRLRPAVDISQRLAVTEIRNNLGMPRPPDLPKFKSIGPRVKWWRKHRGIARKDLAATVGYSVSGLADLENGNSQGSEKLHLIAAELRLNPHYLESDDGEPEADHPQEAPPIAEEWPFPKVAREQLKNLTTVERKFAEMQLLEALSEIEQARRQGKKTG